MKAGGLTSACGREEDLFVPSVLSPRTAYWTQCSSLGLNKEEKDLDSPSVSQMQLPAWKGEKVMMLPGTQEPSVVVPRRPALRNW